MGKKEVWDILETTHEGTKTMKKSIRQMLKARLEEIRMIGAKLLMSSMPTKMT